MPRRFKNHTRDLLYILADGKCEMCGCDLDGVFDIDHIIPWVMGGETSINNAQVLCQSCNRSKGGKLMQDFPFTLREWQQKAFNTFLASGQNTLISATPGAGKTIYGLKCAHSMLSDGSADFLGVIVPSDALRDQWAKEASRIGIHLSTVAESYALANDYHGIVTTYAALSQDSAKTALAFHGQRKKSIAILDEPHHLGTSLSWGTGTREALENYQKRLLITGTPFRSDGEPIPYVNYEEIDGCLVSKCDFVYGYGDALRDGVVRPIYFEKYDGEVRWFESGEEISAKVSDSLPGYMTGKQKRYTLKPNGDWMRDVLRKANDRLNDIRAEEDSRAGGLVITYDQMHAHSVAREMEKILGFKPVVVVSDSGNGDDGKQLIEDFRYSNEPWIIAVKMVSEGVDIKRLRVEVFATLTETELFFRQAIGRVARVDPNAADFDSIQSAYVYIPTFTNIVEYAEKIKEERAHVIDDLNAWIESLDEELSKVKDQENMLPTDMFSVFLSSESDYQGIHYDGTDFTPEQIEAKRSALRGYGMPSDEKTAMAILMWEVKTGINSNENGTKTGNTVDSVRPKTRESKKKEYNKAFSRLRYELIELSNGKLDHGMINGILNQRQGIKKFGLGTASLEQYQKRLEILTDWVSHAKKYPLGYAKYVK